MSSICLKQSNSIINLYLSHFFDRMLYSIAVLWLQLKSVEKYTFCAPCFIRLAISLLFFLSIHFHSELNGYVCNDFFCAAHVVFGFSKMLIKSGMVVVFFFSFTRVVHFSFLRFLAEKKVAYISGKNHRRKQTR